MLEDNVKKCYNRKDVYKYLSCFKYKKYIIGKEEENGKRREYFRI